jgi:hypothetical protein
MAVIVTPAIPSEGGPALPGEVLTRRAVTVVKASIVATTFAFSLGNVTRLCLDLGLPRGSPGWSPRRSTSA